MSLSRSGSPNLSLILCFSPSSDSKRSRTEDQPAQSGASTNGVSEHSSYNSSSGDNNYNYNQWGYGVS